MEKKERMKEKKKKEARTILTAGHYKHLREGCTILGSRTSDQFEKSVTSKSVVKERAEVVGFKTYDDTTYRSDGGTVETRDSLSLRAF